MFSFCTLRQFTKNLLVYFTRMHTSLCTDKTFDGIRLICSPTTGTSNDCDLLAGRNDKGQVVQNRFAVLISEVDVSEFNGRIFFTD